MSIYTDDVGLSLQEAFAALRDTVADMMARGRITRIAGVKPDMQRRVPAFDERRIGFSSFGEFVDAAAKRGFVRVDLDEQGWLRVVAPAASVSTGPPDMPERLRPDLWRAFTEWGEGWVRCWDRATARAVRLPIASRPGEPADHAALRSALSDGSGSVIKIDPVPMNEQQRWMRDFTLQLGPHALARPLAAALEDERPFRAFSAVLNADPALRRRFHRVRFANVLDAVRHWAAANNVDVDALDHDAEPTPSSGVTSPQAPRGDSTQVLRAALHRAIDDMPVDELRRLSVPVGYVVDALR